MNVHVIIKVVTGIVVVPFALAANKMWPWWVKAPLAVKILSGIFVLPIVGFAYATSAWWEGF
jgi:hypothetical protein